MISLLTIKYTYKDICWPFLRPGMLLAIGRPYKLLQTKSREHDSSNTFHIRNINHISIARDWILTWSTLGLCKKISAGKSLNRTSLRNSQDLETKDELRLCRRLAVTDKMCLSLADKGSHGRKVRLDLSLEFPVNKLWDMEKRNKSRFCVIVPLSLSSS